MESFAFTFLRYALLCLLFAGCNLFQDEEVDEDLVDVTYFVPVYETTAQLAQRWYWPAKDCTGRENFNLPTLHFYQ